MALWNNLTGRQILVFLGNLRGGVDAGYVEELAGRLQLDLNKKFRELSRGMRSPVKK